MLLVYVLMMHSIGYPPYMGLEAANMQKLRIDQCHRRIKVLKNCIFFLFQWQSTM